VDWVGAELPGGGVKGTAWADCQGVPAERKAIAPRLAKSVCFMVFREIHEYRRDAPEKSVDSC
jgi:hypothetical protein